MSLTRYLVGWALLAAWIVPLSVAAVAVRRRFAPGWVGALARVAESVLVLSVLLATAQLLGTVGALRRAPMTAGCLVVGALGLLVAHRAPRRASPGDDAPPVGRLGWAVTVGVCALLAVQWGMRVSDTLDAGVSQTDSLTYHLPYAYEFFRSGWTTRLVLNFPGGGVSFHPVDSELLHGLGMLAFGRDSLTPFLNLGWLALALLAAWCLGRPTGHGPQTLTAVGLVFATPLMWQTQPGSGTSDTALIACLLSMAVFLLNAWRQPQARFPLVLAGAAGGLALSSKFNAIPVVAAVTVLVPVLAPSGRRRAATAAWAVPLLATGSFWYLRNLVRVGNPVPMMHLGPLPVSHQALLERYGYSVLSYATDWQVVRHSFLPGLRIALGPLWLPLLATAVAAVLLATRATTARLPGIAFAAAVGALGYLATPTSAFGARGHPLAFLFVSNVRYLLPPIALALALVPLVVPRRPRWQRATLPVLATAILVTALWHSGSLVTGHTKRFAALTAGVAVSAAALRLVRGLRVPAAAVAAGVVVAGLVAGFPVSGYYLDHRYAVAAPDTADAYLWARGLHGTRIGIDGFTEGYALTGTDLSNEVSYVGQVGPHDSLRDFTDCPAYLHAVDAGGYRYLVFAQRLTLAPSGRESLRWPSSAGWVSQSPHVRLVLRSGLIAVYRVTGPLGSGACGRTSVPFAELRGRPATPGRVA